jgi:hypothetical protein
MLKEEADDETSDAPVRFEHWSKLLASKAQLAALHELRKAGNLHLLLLVVDCRPCERARTKSKHHGLISLVPPIRDIFGESPREPKVIYTLCGCAIGPAAPRETTMDEGVLQSTHIDVYTYNLGGESVLCISESRVMRDAIYDGQRSAPEQRN